MNHAAPVQDGNRRGASQCPPFEKETGGSVNHTAPVQDGNRRGASQCPPFEMEINGGHHAAPTPNRNKQGAACRNHAAPIQNGKERGQRVGFTHPRSNEKSPPTMVGGIAAERRGGTNTRLPTSMDSLSIPLPPLFPPSPASPLPISLLAR